MRKYFFPNRDKLRFDNTACKYADKISVIKFLGLSSEGIYGFFFLK